MSEHAPRSSLASCFRSIRKENFYLSPCSMVGHHTHGSCAGLLMLSMTSISVTKLHGLSRSTTKVANLGCYAEGGSAVLVGDSIDCLVPGTSSFNREIVLEPKPSHQSWYLWPHPTIESTSHPSLPQKPQPLPQLLHPNYIPKRQTNPRPPFAPPPFKPPPIPHQPPIRHPLRPQPLIHHHLRYPMQTILVHLPRRNQQTPRLQQNPPPWPLLPRPLPSLRVHVQHGRRPERHRCYDGMVGGAIFVREDALAGAVFVDQDVVRGAVGRVREDVGGEGEQAWD
ncbi:hypothetical protein LPUS_00388 [Lasallia pustulata]|uniref:Uncharacterized protein n=1 Tax=Lasallia pustulata TaxID=136370 RepID=A0A1W5CXP0_9LECA|nr:hypothetical protein LPUS_00388 [Lasallia pustulata]